MNDISTSKLKVNSQRLWDDLMALGKIGEVAGSGVTRPAFSEADIEAREWLVERMTQAGLKVRVDAALNVIGTLKAKFSKTRKVAALGSHLDTVPQGGKFDGALGIIAALECARTIKENDIALPWDIEVIGFCDEEGAFNAGTVGSRAIFGELKEEEIYISKIEDGASFAQGLSRCGKDPAKINQARRDPSDFEFFMEMHIEQGTRLESRGIQVAAVTAIVGMCRILVTAEGRAGHSGTTEMQGRRDALVMSAPLFHLLPEWVQDQNPEMVGTIGQVTLAPGAANVIPGKCTFSIELRSQNSDDIEAVRKRILDYVDQHEGFTSQTTYRKGEVPLDEKITQQILRSAEMCGLSCTEIPSGAGHDAQTFAYRVPTGMIFVPCRDGISHNPAEWIEPENAADGAQVLLQSIIGLANS